VRDTSTPFIYLAESKVIDILRAPVEEYRSRYVVDLGLEEWIGFRVELAAAPAGGRKGIECRRLEVESGATAWRVTDLASGTSRP